MYLLVVNEYVAIIWCVNDLSFSVDLQFSF